MSGTKSNSLNPLKKVTLDAYVSAIWATAQNLDLFIIPIYFGRVLSFAVQNFICQTTFLGPFPTTKCTVIKQDVRSRKSHIVKIFLPRHLQTYLQGLSSQSGKCISQILANSNVIMHQNASKCMQNELCKCFVHEIIKEVFFFFI